MYHQKNLLPLDNLPPLSIYIHIPWCIRKCPYCDFNSHAVNSSKLPEQEYIDSLLRDFDQDYDLAYGREVHSIFIGGGTPSLFSARSLERLLLALKKRISFSSKIEISIEANPGSFERDKFLEYRHIGINRLSVGVQSFQERKLALLGRIHTGIEAVNSIINAHQAGFDNINLDLMYGLPEQSTEDALYDLEQAIALRPTHISWYQLTIEPNTAFWKKPPVAVKEKILWSIFNKGRDLLLKNGFLQYEISSYAQPNRLCQHNLNYWNFGDFIGIGAGAHGKITATNGEIIRMWKTSIPKNYLNKDDNFHAGHRLLTPSELPFEFLMNTLRLNKGVSSSLYYKCTRLSLDSLKKGRKISEEEGLLDKDPNKLVATPKGRLFLNNLLGNFLA